MSQPPPVVYLLHGEDEYAIAQFVSGLEAKLGESVFGGGANSAAAALNITRLDGRTTSLEDIRLAAGALPFLAERRLVIVNQPTAKLNNTAQQDQFIALLERLTPSTALVLVEYRNLIDEKAKPPKKHWLLQWAEAAGPRAYIKHCSRQRGQALTKWIQDQARQAGGQFSQPAAELLGALVGEDTRLAHAEIQKLLAYVNYNRPVAPDDVENLTEFAGQADIFEMVDALGNQNGRQAIGLLHRLLDQQDPPSIFGMVVRQFRLMLQAREILDSGGQEADVARAVKIRPFVARKVTAQARHFSLPVLETVYRRLLLLDEAIKTGQVEGDVALDTFVAAFTTRSA